MHQSIDVHGHASAALQYSIEMFVMDPDFKKTGVPKGEANDQLCLD